MTNCAHGPAPSLILLREIPDVELFEYRFHEHGSWTDELEDWAHGIAESLFGISEYDIDDDWDDDKYFPVLRYMRDEGDAYWAKHGWDVTDGNGKELRIMDCLTRPMVCLVEKLHPDARFTLADEAWAERLEADAKQFRPSRPRE